MSRLNNENVKGILKTDGVRFVNEDGKEVILNGWGTANWENTEGFMIGSAPLPRNLFKWILFPGPGNDHNPERWTSRRFVSQQVRELCGQKYLDTYWDRWEENHLREEDIKLMADMGYNCVRIVLNANALLYEEPGINFNEGGFSRLAKIIDACEKTGCKLSVIPIYAEYMAGNSQIDDLDGIPLLNVRRIPLDNLANAFIKRAMDIVGSALILIVFSPLMLVCAIGVKLSSPGPVIFAQKRVGRNKEPFMMYKFRSMRVNDKQDTGWSSTHDDRKTRFGSFIRKYSLDEFPQFWNVLKGDMSLVGPRPEVPFYVEQFKEEVPRYMLKHLVRPGITGWAQINGLRGDTSIPQRIRYDIYYIEHWSLAFDMKILFRTVFGGKFKNEESMK